MSFSWTTSRSVLESIFKDATGLRCEWIDGPQSYGGSMKEASASKAHGELSLRMLSGVGLDKLYHTYDEDADPGEEITYFVSGYRTLLWQVKVRSWRSSPDVDSHAFLEDLRSYIRSPAATEYLRSADMGYESMSANIDVGAFMHDRRESIAQIDVRLNTYICKEVSKNTWIEHVYAETDWKDQSGTSLPEELQIDGELTEN